MLIIRVLQNKTGKWTKKLQKIIQKIWRERKNALLLYRNRKGSIAQLVQSICLTSRGSAVRIRVLPPRKAIVNSDCFFILPDREPLNYLPLFLAPAIEIKFLAFGLSKRMKKSRKDIKRNRTKPRQVRKTSPRPTRTPCRPTTPLFAGVQPIPCEPRFTVFTPKNIYDDITTVRKSEQKSRYSFSMIRRFAVSTTNGCGRYPSRYAGCSCKYELR